MALPKRGVPGCCDDCEEGICNCTPAEGLCMPPATLYVTDPWGTLELPMSAHPVSGFCQWVGSHDAVFTNGYNELIDVSGTIYCYLSAFPRPTVTSCLRYTVSCPTRSGGVNRLPVTAHLLSCRDQGSGTFGPPYDQTCAEGELGAAAGVLFATSFTMILTPTITTCAEDDTFETASATFGHTSPVPASHGGWSAIFSG